MWHKSQTEEGGCYELDRGLRAEVQWGLCSVNIKKDYSSIRLQNITVGEEK